MSVDPSSDITVSVKGYRSLVDVSFELGDVTLLIGANGSGKSNLVDLFRLVEWMMRGDLQMFIARAGGAATLLHNGPKMTEQIDLRIVAPSQDERFQKVEAGFVMEWSADDTLFLLRQEFGVHRAGDDYEAVFEMMRASVRECVLLTRPDFGGDNPAPEIFRKLLSGWKVYHFQDTSAQAGIRRASDLSSGLSLRETGENLAAFLLHLREHHRAHYDRIVAVIASVAPYFRDFLLVSVGEKVSLRWRSTTSEYEFGPHQLSDGTLRFMALAALLLQPEEKLPSLIVLDEPELGLHPYALSILASLVRSVSSHCRIVLATQSAPLLDLFEPEDIRVVELHDGASTVRRLDSDLLKSWLEEYSVSELWEKNKLGGRPSR
jgi:predicted ATPase